MTETTSQTHSMAFEVGMVPGELAKALVAVQNDMPHATRDATNPFFNSGYPTLQSVVDAYRPVLAKHGLAITQWPEGNTLVTILVHESGQSMRSCFGLHAVKEDPQGYGSAITYARRYCAMAVVGMAPADDDAEAAMGRTKTAAKAKPKPTPNAREPALASEKKEFFDWLKVQRFPYETEPDYVDDIKFAKGAAFVQLGKYKAETLDELKRVRAAIDSGKINLVTGAPSKEQL